MSQQILFPNSLTLNLNSVLSTKTFTQVETNIENASLEPQNSAKSLIRIQSYRVVIKTRNKHFYVIILSFVVSFFSLLCGEAFLMDDTGASVD
jgi:hypothetical protein